MAGEPGGLVNRDKITDTPKVCQDMGQGAYGGAESILGHQPCELVVSDGNWARAETEDT